MGFEFNERFQGASGINMVPSDNWCHMVVAAGWTPKVGDINIPFRLLRPRCRQSVAYVFNNWRQLVRRNDVVFSIVVSGMRLEPLK